MDFLTDFLRQEAGDLPQPDLHPDFCDEVLQSLTRNQETYQLPDQTYQLPDQHHEYPTSTTNTTNQPSSNHKCLKSGTMIKKYLDENQILWAANVNVAMIPDKEAVKSPGMYVNIKTQQLTYFASPNQDGPPVVPLAREGDAVFPCCWSKKRIGPRTTWVKLYQTITPKVSVRNSN